MIDRLIQLYAHTPEHPAKLRIFAWLCCLLKGRRRLRLNVSGGLVMRLSPHDHVDRSLILTDSHETLTTRFINENLRPGETTVIAGAHIGYHVLQTARAVGPHGRVVAFEPEPQNLLLAREHITLNGFDSSVALLGHALGAAPGYVAMEAPPKDNTGEARLGTIPGANAYRAWVETLAAALARLAVPAFDLLLLDVEGFERQALTGLGDHRPRLMIIESDPRFHSRMAEPQADFFAFVRSLGYELHSLDGSVVHAEGFYPECNLIAVRLGEPSPRWPVPASSS